MSIDRDLERVKEIYEAIEDKEKARREVMRAVASLKKIKHEEGE